VQQEHNVGIPILVDHTEIQVAAHYRNTVGLHLSPTRIYCI